MSAQKSPKRSVRKWIADHFARALTAAFIVVLVFALVLLAAGTWLTPVAPGPKASPTTTTTDPPAVHVTVATSPAASFVSTLVAQLHHELGYTPRYPSDSTSDPLLAGCSSTIPVPQFMRELTLVSPSFDVVVALNVYGAGLGGLVVANTLSATASCSGDYIQSTSPTGLVGFVASGVDVSGSSILEVTFRSGDVVVSLYAFPTNYQSATTATMTLANTINAQLVSALTPVCASENAPASVALRNPTQSDYRPYTTSIQVTPPAQVARPDLALLDGPLPVVPPPPPGSVTSPPAPPTVPTVALSAVVRIPSTDPVGPGCGWAFTAMAPPASPTNTEPLSVLTSTAITQLEAVWGRWPKVAAAYLESKAIYLRDVASYVATTTTTSPTTTTTTTTTTTSTTTTTLASATGATSPASSG